MAVVDTCSPSRNYVWVCIILMHKQTARNFPVFHHPFSQAPSCWIVAWCWMIWDAGRSNWELADHQGCIMSRYHVYKSFGNPDCLECSRFIHQHMYHLPNFDWSYSSTRRYIQNSKGSFLRADVMPRYISIPDILFLSTISTHCY